MDEMIAGEVGPIRLRRYAWALAIVWTAAVGATAVWEMVDAEHHVLELARSEARSALEKNLLFRQWATSHGGVYVPVTEQTQPSPYMEDVPERDVATPSGRRLTLISPTYMMRQINDMASEDYNVHNRLTSLNPVNPDNAPDPWEAEILRDFQEGQKEVSAVETIGGEDHMRLMWPVRTEASCLACHVEREYRPGELRGGMSVWVPMAPLEQIFRTEVEHRAVGYGLMWALGLAGIVVGSRHLGRQIERRQRAEEALRQSEIRARETAAHVPGVVYQFVLHPDGDLSFPYISEGLHEVLGIHPTEAQRDPASLFPGRFLEEDVDAFWASIRESAERMTTWQREMRCSSVDGEERWIQGRSSPHRLPDGSVLFNGVLLDVSEQKEADRKLQEAHDLLERRVAERTAELEEANRDLQKEVADRKQAEKWLLESEERFRGFFELGVVGMAIISPEGDWEEVNHRLCEILGLSEHDLLKSAWAELIHPDDREADAEQMKRVASGVIGGYSTARRFVRRDGQIVYTDLSVRCLRRGDGTVDSVIVLAQDVTADRRAKGQPERLDRPKDG